MKKSKQIRNRKNVAQNLRNKLINRRYTSLLKTFSKQFKILAFSILGNSKTKFKNQKDISLANHDVLKQKAKLTFQNVTSILDKAKKKKVIHKNTVARKKSVYQKILNKIYSS